ncbi:MAG: gumH [Sphingomonadales bacterium]|nr:gumH [Sphingomonadales bacterium]
MDVDRRLRVGEVDIAIMEVSAALALLCESIAGRENGVFGFANAHSVNLARRLPIFTTALRQMTVFNDGIGIELAARILTGESLPANLNGTDLTPALLAKLPAGTRVFLLGSPHGVAETARSVFAQKFPALDFVGARDGYFDEAAGTSVAQEVAATGPQLVIVGMGQPRQELWATQHAASIGAVLLCAGAILDFTAGRFRRAPKWVLAARLEWAYRLVLEPRRLAQRYLVGNASFAINVMQQRFRS